MRELSSGHSKEFEPVGALVSFQFTLRRYELFDFAVRLSSVSLRNADGEAD